MKTLFALILFCTATAQGQILFYKRTIHSTQIGNGFTWRDTEFSYLIVDAETGAVGEFNFDSQAPKEYSFGYRKFTIESLDGGPGKQFTVFAEVAVDTNAPTPYKYSSTARGLNLPLDVGLVGKRPVPRTMQFIRRDVYRFGITPFIDEAAGTLRLDLPGTQKANSAHKTLEDVVATIRADLTARDYRDNTPP